MSYCGLADIKRLRIPEQLLIQLTDDDQVGAVDTDTVNDIIAGADGMIDDHIRGVVSLPLTATPPIIKEIALDICAFRLYGRRALDDVPEHVGQAYRDALSTLKSIRKGDIHIDAADAKQSSPVRFYAI